MHKYGWFYLALFAVLFPAVFFVLGTTMPSLCDHPPSEQAAQYCAHNSPYQHAQAAFVGFVSWLGDSDNITMLSTVVIAIFTMVLAYVTNRQAKFTRESIDLARREFIATHRPRIIVRSIGEDGRVDGWEVVVIVIVNVGETKATITAIASDIARRNRRTGDWEEPGMRVSVAGVEPIDPFELEGGEAYVWTVTARRAWGLADTIGDVELCVAGQILYRDDNGIVRETGFFRVREDRSGGRFVASDNPEIEYQD